MHLLNVISLSMRTQRHLENKYKGKHQCGNHGNARLLVGSQPQPPRNPPDKCASGGNVRKKRGGRRLARIRILHKAALFQTALRLPDQL